MDERQDAIRTILDLGHIPAGMELFPADNIDQLVYIKKIIDECDYYVLIVGNRYGSVDIGGVGYTEREYDYAVESGKVVLAFVHGNPGSIPLGKSDVDPRLVEMMDNFREKVKSGRIVQFWTTREQLDNRVTKAIVRATSEYPMVGWVRGDVAASEDLLSKLNDLRNQNDALTKEVSALNGLIKPNIEGIADLSASFSIPYSVRLTRSSGTSYRETRIFNSTWGSIFSGISRRYIAPRPRGELKQDLESYVAAKTSSSTTSIAQDVVDIIEAQFIGLSLISL